MADDKTKRGNPDAYLISFKEKYEVEYAIKQLQKTFPEASKSEAKTALLEAAKKIDPSKGRERIMRQARKTLKAK